MKTYGQIVDGKKTYLQRIFKRGCSKIKKVHNQQLQTI
jgi:hypothetical protein